MRIYRKSKWNYCFAMVRLWNYDSTADYTLTLLTQCICFTRCYCWWLDVDSNDILACQMTQALDLVCPLMMTVSHNQPLRKIDGDEVWIAPLVFLLFAADNGNVNDGDSLGFGRSEEACLFFIVLKPIPARRVNPGLEPGRV
jgi:hypothetical protein